METTIEDIFWEKKNMIIPWEKKNNKSKSKSNPSQDRINAYDYHYVYRKHILTFKEPKIEE